MPPSPRLLAPARHASVRCFTQTPPTSTPSIRQLLPRHHASISPSPPPLARPFSSTSACSSRIGRAPLSIPEGVSFQVFDPPPLSDGVGRQARLKPTRTVRIQGPLGEMTEKVPTYIAIDQSDSATPTLSVLDVEDSEQRSMWGTMRAHLNNHIVGVSEGHVAILRLVGVGYRATIESSATTKKPAYPGQQFVNLKVGYSHPIELGIPEGVKASTPQPTRILLEGVNKVDVTQFAADIKWWRRPEPYKGKGIFVNDETIKLKSKRLK